MKALKTNYEKGLHTLIKPTREVYEEQLLGPKVFAAGSSHAQRHDFAVKNAEG